TCLVVHQGAHVRGGPGGIGDGHCRDLRQLLLHADRFTLQELGGGRGGGQFGDGRVVLLDDDRVGLTDVQGLGAGAATAAGGGDDGQDQREHDDGGDDGEVAHLLGLGGGCGGGFRLSEGLGCGVGVQGAERDDLDGDDVASLLVDPGRRGNEVGQGRGVHRSGGLLVDGHGHGLPVDLP